MDKFKSILKKNIKLIVTMIVIVAVLVTSVIIIKENGAKVYSYSLYALMPKTISAEEMETDYDMHVRLNDDYDFVRQLEDPLEAYEYYYTDPQTGEEVVIGGSEQTQIGDVTIAPYLMFVIKAKENFDMVKKVITAVIWIIIAAAIVLGIVLWYKSWARREDEKKNKIHKNNK